METAVWKLDFGPCPYLAEENWRVFLHFYGSTLSPPMQICLQINRQTVPNPDPDLPDWWVSGTIDPFRHLNPDCWFPVAKGNSTFHVNVADFRTGRGQFYHPDGWRGTMPKEVWVLGLHARDASVRYRRSMSLYRFSCQGEVRRFALLKFISFSSSGEILEDREATDASWRIAIPDTKEQSLAGFVCGTDIPLLF